jgi:multiple sugar transport system permease protein
MRVKGIKIEPRAVSKHFVLLFGTALMILPFLWMFSTSLKPPAEVLSWPPKFVPRTVTIDNYIQVFDTAPFGRFFLNSLLMSCASTLCVVITSTLAGYIFGKFKFPLKSFLFILILATAMVPFETYMIPLYLRMVKFRWVNTFIGLACPYLVMSYGIFFMRQNVEATIPEDLLDMARIDGVSEFGIYTKMVLPLLSGSVGALSIFAFMQSWAAFIWPLIITSTRDLWTMELGLGMFQYRFTVDLGPINAGSMLSIVPVLIVFLVLRKRIVQGITLSGMKE